VIRGLEVAIALILVFLEWAIYMIGVIFGCGGSSRS